MPSPHRSPRITAAITPVSLRTLAILFVALCSCLPLPARAVPNVGEVNPGPPCTYLGPLAWLCSLVFDTYHYLSPAGANIGRVYVDPSFFSPIEPGTVTTAPTSPSPSGANIGNSGNIRIWVSDDETAQMLGCPALTPPGYCTIGSLDSSGNIRSADTSELHGTLTRAWLLVD